MLLEHHGVEFWDREEEEFDVVAAGDVLQLADRANVLQGDWLRAVRPDLTLPVQKGENVPDPREVWEQFSFGIGIVCELAGDVAFFLELFAEGQLLGVWPELLLQEFS
ncbi:hypothetical protein ACFOHY_17440 [Rhizobium rosettiformans]|uniref:hypothetical protein n=1 Tax=Rhizobium rosettiformans TaxID=1368430 RepID=UPI0026C0CB52